MTVEHHAKPGPAVFVLGTQRSGTTLLCRMLTAHPDLFIQNELNVRRIFGDHCDTNEVLANIYRLMEEEQCKPLNDLLRENSKTCWGLKDPELTYYLDRLEPFLPSTRFLVIIRDARAVVASYKNNGWGLGTNAYTGALRWLHEVAVQRQFQEAHPNSVLTLRFEDLIHEPQVWLERICTFMDLPFSESMLRYDTQPSFYEVGRENRMTFSLPDPKIVDRWRHELRERERRIVAHVCGEVLNELGYKVEDTPYAPSRLETLFFEWHQRIIGELQIQYRWRQSRLKQSLKRFRSRKLASKR